MAKVLKKGFEFPTRQGGFAAKHDWNKWCDGQTYQLDQGDIGDGTFKTFCMMLRNQAKKRGCIAQTALIDDGTGLVVQARKMTKEELAAYEARKAAKKAKKAAEQE